MNSNPFRPLEEQPTGNPPRWLPLKSAIKTHRVTLILSALLTAALVYGISAGVATFGWAEQDTALRADLGAVTTERDKLLVEVDDYQKRAHAAEGELEDAQSRLDDREVELDARATELDEQATGLADREKAVEGAEAQVEANRITEGTWTVGVDVEAGTYRTTEAVSSGMCYWGIHRSGSNGSDIIENDIVNGGFPTVTLSAGQDFTTSDCGTWDKQ